MAKISCGISRLRGLVVDAILFSLEVSEVAVPLRGMGVVVLIALDKKI